MPSRDELVDVEIVYAHDPDTDGPDLNRIGTIERYPRNVAKGMVNSGAARWPTGSPEAPNLEAMTRAQLVSEARVRGVAVPRDATRTDTLAILRNAINQQTTAAEAEQTADLDGMTVKELRDTYPAAAGTGDSGNTGGTGQAGGAPIVTVAPGADNNPDRDQTTTSPVDTTP